MLIEKIKTELLIPADYNPRKDLKPGDPEYEKLKRSLEEFGYVEPVIWNKTTGRVIGGHQRLKILLSMGMDEIECVVVEMDEDKEKALNIALNKISGDWDKEKLALLITDLNAADFDVSLTGFDPGELDDLFKDTLKDKIREDDFDVDSELSKPAVSRLGDVWILKFYLNMVLPLYSENMVLSPTLWRAWDEETQMAYTYYANIHGPEAMRMGMCIGYGLKNAARDKSEKV